jgi:drug/metabolite transporter (DMT)-like permease
MLFLILSVLISSYLGIVFTLFKRVGIDSFQAIVFNYLTCVITGSLYAGGFPLSAQTLSEPWFPWALVMGSMFIATFSLIAISSLNVGVTITQTANKLSLVIPVSISFWVYHEPILPLKIAGIMVAILAVFLLSYAPKKSEGNANSLRVLLPLILFVSSGFIDSLTTFVQRAYIHTEAIANAYLIAGFLAAGTWGSIVLGIQYAKQQRAFAWRHLVGGIVLGVPNYFSIYFLIKALENPSLNSSAIIPINNIGILLVVSICGIFFFKEKLKTIHYVGLLLAGLSIALIYGADSFLWP